MYDEASSTQPNYSSLGPTYDIVAANDEMTNGYVYIKQPQDVINTSRFKAANPTPVSMDNEEYTTDIQNTRSNSTPVRDEARKKGDDIYDAEEHTYSVVNVKGKKRGNEKTAMNGEGEKEEDY